MIVMLLTAYNWPVVSLVINHIAIGTEVLGMIPGPVKSNTMSPTARRRCDVSSELCCPGAKPQRWAPILISLFGVIPQVTGKNL